MAEKPKIKFSEAIKSLLDEGLRKAIFALLALLAKHVLNIYGASVLLFFSTLLLSSWVWLRSPIPVPIYVIFALPTASILIVLMFQQLHKKHKHKKFEFEGLLWRLNKSNEIVGPYCPKCGADMVITDDQWGNAANIICRKEPEYIFTCEDGHQFKKNTSPSDMIRLVKKHFTDKILV